MAKLNRNIGTTHAHAVKYKKVIKINPFTSPLLALDAISKISSYKPTNDASDVVKAVIEKVSKGPDGDLKGFFNERRAQRDIRNLDFWNDFLQKLNDIKVELEANEREVNARVIVAGGFGSGKSTFLNSVVGVPDLLPTDIAACSVIPTYLYAATGQNGVRVKGLNLRGAVVPLSRDVLQCIKHESSSEVYFSSVLDKLFVEVPNNNSIHDLAFIDTPGYDRAAVEGEARTDRETTIGMMNEGNVLFWLVDVNVGAINNDDLKIINLFEGCKMVIVLNKADMLPSRRVDDIRDDIRNMFEPDYDSEKLMDIITYSSVDPNAFSSLRGFASFTDLLDEVRKVGSYNRVNQLTEDIEALFDDEIETCNDIIVQYHKLFDNENIEKTKVLKYVNEKKDQNEEFIKRLESMVVDDYHYLQVRISKLYSLSNYSYESFKKFYIGICNYHSGRWIKPNILTALCKVAKNDLDKFNARKNDLPLYTCYSDENRKHMVKAVGEKCAKLNEAQNKVYKNLINKCQSYLDGIEHQLEMKSTWIHWKEFVMKSLVDSVTAYQASVEGMSAGGGVETDGQTDVFTAIASGNAKDFMLCFKDGVDIENTYNDDGYTPLTYAVRLGANDVVQFFIDQGANLGYIDKRGYNAYLTAVENNYKDLCTLIANARPDLRDLCSREGLTAHQIAEQNTFSEWLRQNYNTNA